MHARWLTIASLISVGALSLAAGATGAAAASRSTSQAHSFVSTAMAGRAQPRAVTRGSHLGTIQHMNIAPAGPVVCNDQWNVVPSQNAGTNQNNELNSVSAISSTDAYAVGDVDIGATSVLRRAVTEHWDGTQWILTTNQPTAVGTGDNNLLSVTAVATNNVWAVGYSKADNNSGTLRNVLIEHYDGTNWTATVDGSTNNPASASNSLFGIKFFGASDIWAVGDSITSATAAAPLIEHYDGTAWTIKPGAAVSSSAFLSDVLPLSATDVWAAGAQSSGGPFQTLIEHYDGTSWTVSPSQNPNVGGQFLNDIAGVAGDIWVVGGQAKTSSTDDTLTEHWNGTAWTVVASPTPDLSANLIGVRYGAANDVWAVGATAYSSPNTVNELDHSLIEHWDGTHWYQVPSPNPSNHTVLFDSAIASPNQILTVGFTQDAVAGGASSTLAADLCEPTPVVSSLNPDHGNSAGGNAVQIIGSGLLYPRSVMFGAMPATSYTINSDSMITAVPPAQLVGTMVNVTVMTMGGTSATGTGNVYTYFGPGAWENAGGVLASGPAVSSWGLNELDVFVSGTDGVLYHRNTTNNTVTWEALPGVTPASDASSVSTGSGLIDVFVRGSDGALWHRHFSNTPTPTWSAWEKLGGMISGAPAAVSVGSGNLAVFVQGTDNHLWYDTLIGTAWSWHLAGGVLAAPPAAVSAATNTADAFVEGGDSALWRYSITSVSTATASWGTSSLGGKLASKPAATVRGTGIDVFVEGTDSGLWHWSTMTGGVWEGVGGKLAAAPAAVSWGSSRLDVFVEGTDSAVYHAWSTSASVGTPWSWEGVGGKIIGSPAAVTWSINRLDVFARGADNHLWHIPFN
jgi:IPT/TIG domain